MTQPVESKMDQQRKDEIDELLAGVAEVMPTRPLLSAGLSENNFLMSYRALDSLVTKAEKQGVQRAVDSAAAEGDKRFALIPLNRLVGWKLMVQTLLRSDDPLAEEARRLAREMLAYALAPTVDDRPLEWPPLQPIAIDEREVWAYSFHHAAQPEERHVFPAKSLSPDDLLRLQDVGFRMIPLYPPKEPQ